MKSILAMLLAIGVLQGALLLMGLGVGFLLHWVIPDLSIGTAVLVGAMCSISSGLLLIQFLHFVPHVPFGAVQEDGDEDEEDEDDEEEFEDIEIRAVRPRSRAGRRHRSRRR